MLNGRRTSLAGLALAGLLTASAGAVQIGAVTDYVLYTDIVANIDGCPIPSYNVAGDTVVVAEDLIDVYHISVIPTILGEGIPLFAPQERTIPLHLERTESSNGITGLIYRRRQPPAATARTGTPPRR